MPPKKKGAEAEEPKGAVRFGRARNTLKFGLVGLPNVGKSSLFNLFTEQNAAAENFPFCTIDPNESRCPVPDSRFDYLCQLWKPPSEIPAYLHITDIAGLVKGASEGAGLGNNFLSHIQAVDGYFHVVRAFDSIDVLHVEESVDPVRDMETISYELCQKDLAALDKAVADEIKDVKRSPGFKLSEIFHTTMDKVRALLEANKPVRDGEWTSPEIEMIKKKLYMLITTKPCIYLVNMSAKDYIRKKNKWLVKIKTWIDEHGGDTMIPMSVEYEQELWNMREDKTKLTEQTKIAKSVLPRAVKSAYHGLGLVHFLTAGEKEVRCWTIQSGTAAPQAASVIHSDIEKGFIKAEVVSFADFKEHGSMAAVKSAGRCRQEGKTYIVQDGDVILFQHNAAKSKK